MMRTDFVRATLTKLIGTGLLSRDDHLLAICAGSAERDVFAAVGMRRVTISNLSASRIEGEIAPYDWSRQDAHALTFADNTHDFVFVSDGLHHCSSPHRALLEMYRVARKGVIVFESRDSHVMRVAEALGLTQTYEILAVTGNGYVAGGVNNSCVPNYIYRWTEAEFKKTLKSFDPSGPHEFRFFYGLNLPAIEAAPIKARLLALAAPALRLITRIARRQCNSFAMVALKPTKVWPWLQRTDEGLAFKRDYQR
jgi:SAM-dependent methyltransferase